MASKKTLRRECDEPGCFDGERWASKYGGNDPDVWHVGECWKCDGCGWVSVKCDCGRDATETLLYFPDEYFCETCVIDARDFMDSDEAFMAFEPSYPNMLCREERPALVEEV
jgi:hypothetical protein